MPRMLHAPVMQPARMLLGTEAFICHRVLCGLHVKTQSSPATWSSPAEVYSSLFDPDGSDDKASGARSRIVEGGSQNFRLSRAEVRRWWGESRPSS